jgi:MSHA biogenesis protein MshL
VVTLNVRPTVTKIIGFVDDPNPALRGSLTTPSISSKIPETQTREMESVLRVASGQTAILGGLMQDSFVGSRDGLPVASRIPIFGDLFSYRNDAAVKTELVVFLRPLVVRNATVEGDLGEFKRLLPDRDFFRDTRPPVPEFQEGLRRIQRGESPPLTPNPVVPDSPAAAK